jgi:hypothetical protein
MNAPTKVVPRVAQYTVINVRCCSPRRSRCNTHITTHFCSHILYDLVSTGISLELGQYTLTLGLVTYYMA